MRVMVDTNVIISAVYNANSKPAVWTPSMYFEMEM